MNAKIVEPQNLRRGFRQSFHRLDYFFMPVDIIPSKLINSKQRHTPNSYKVAWQNKGYEELFVLLPQNILRL